MKNKKPCAFLLIILMLFSSCAPSPQDLGKESSQALFDTQQEISIGYWNIQQMAGGVSDPMRDYVENRFAITISPIPVDWNNYKDYYQMLSATGSLPDVFATLTISSNNTNDSAFYESLIESGSLTPLPDDLSAWPNLMKTMEMVDYTRYRDGKFYAIPRVSFMDSSLSSSDAALIVRRDWMEKLGFGNPQSFDEFLDMITAFAKDDPDGNGLDDTIGFNDCATTALSKWVMLGIAPECNVYSWIEKDGRFIPSWYSDDFKAVVTAFRQMYKSGGLDPDFYTKNPNEVLDDFASGRLGALEYKSSPSSLQQLYNAWSRYQTGNFEDCVDVLPIFPAPDGITYSNSSSLFWSESFISSSVPPEKLERILALYDFLLSEEGLRLSKFGLKGIDYDIDEKGDLVCLLDTSENSMSSQLKAKYPSIELFGSLATWGGTFADFVPGDMNYHLCDRNCVNLAYKDLMWNKENASMLTRPERFLITPKEPSEVFSTGKAFSAFIRCIVGSDDALAMWEESVRQMQAAGLEEYIDRQNEIYRKQLPGQ